MTEAPIDLAEALKSGENRPELKFFVAMADALGFEASMVRRSLRPDVSLFGMGGTMQRADGMSDTSAKFGLVVSVPLSDGGMRSAKSKMLQAKADEFLAQAEQMRLQVRREIETAWAEWATSDKVRESARAELVSAQEAYDVERIRFESGKSTMAELLDVLAALAQARVSVLEAERFADAARARLARAVGQRPSSSAATHR
jgi:outer membrane protein TolC